MADYSIERFFSLNQLVPAVLPSNIEWTCCSIRPGVGTVQSADDFTTDKRNVTTADTLMDLVRNLFPENIIQACLEKVQTVIKYPGTTPVNSTIQEEDKDTWKFEENWSRGSNILGLIVASLVRKDIL